MPIDPASAAVRKLLNDAANYPDGLSADNLLARAKALFPGQKAPRLTALIDAALSAGHLAVFEGIYRSTPHRTNVADVADVADGEGSGPDPGSNPASESPSTATRGTLRAVTVDLESVVRATTTAPYVEKRIYQLGAARTGTDTAWIANQPTFSAWVQLPNGQWPIRSDTVRALHAAGAVAPEAALAALSAYCDTAELVIAYNGLDADFPLLAAAFEQHGLANLPGEYVDGYYLTLSVYPSAGTHRLGSLAAELGIDMSALHWHDAGHDASLLDRVLRRAAADFNALGPDLISLDE